LNHGSGKDGIKGDPASNETRSQYRPLSFPRRTAPVIFEQNCQGLTHILAHL